MDVNAAVRTQVDRQPLRHAGLVSDLAYDRRGTPRRGIDPAIVSRHAVMVEDDLRGIIDEAAPTAADRLSVAQSAASALVHHTHEHMIRCGHLMTDIDAGAVAGGRMLFAAAVAHRLAARQEGCLQSV
jgi:hypothetical protein